MKFYEYLRSTGKIAEHDEVNEYSGDEATDVNFGLFSWGGGGEIDTMAAGAAAATALLMKSLWNGGVYARLKSNLPEYLEKYKLTEAPKSRDVFDEKWDSSKIAPLKKQKDVLLGTGGSREDKDVRGGGDEVSAKKKVEDYFKNLKDKITGEGSQEKKAALSDKEEKALQQIDLKIQKLQDQLEREEAARDVEWEKLKEDWRQYEEKFTKKSEGKLGFVEVRDSILASSWRKKWDKEFTIAKRKASIEVLDEALKIAQEKKNTKEIEAITGAKKRAKESEAAAQEAIEANTDAEERAEAQQADMSDLGVVQYMQSQGAIVEKMVDSYDKWDGIYKDASSAQPANNDKKDERGKKEELEYKIANAEEKIKRGKEKAQEIRDAGNNEKADKVDQAIKKIQQDIESYKEELAKLGESVTEAAYYSLLVRLNEGIKMLGILLEEEGKEEQDNRPPSFTDVRKIMMKAINAVPDDETAKKLATEALADVEEIKKLVSDMVEKRNQMVDKFADNEDKKLPDGAEHFSSMKKLDLDDQLSTFTAAIADLKEQGAEGKKAEEEPKPAEEPKKEEPKPAEEEPKSTEEPKPAEEEPKEEEPKEEEPKEEEPKEEEPKEEEPESEEVKKIKADIAEQKDRLEAIKKKAKDPKSPLQDPKTFKLVMDQEEGKLKKLEDNLEKAKQPDKKEESANTKIAPKYMKFEEFMALKNQS